MAIYVSEGSSSDYQPLPEDVYIAACYGLVDLGDVYSEKYDNVKPRFMILWELMDTGVDGGPNRTITKEYGKTLSKKSILRKDLRAWRGREFTDEELKKFNMVNILGAPCQIQVVNSKSADGAKTYNNIGAIMTLPKGMPKPTPTRPAINWDFEECEVVGEAWEAIPEWIRNRIEKSETYLYITKGERGHLSDERIKEIEEFQSYKELHNSGEFEVVEDPDQDLPF